MINKLAKRYFIFLLFVVSSGILFLPVANIVEFGWPKDYKSKTLKALFSIDILETHINYALFKAGVSGYYEKVVIGKNGWLYLGDFDKKGLSRGRNVASVAAKDADIERWLDSMSARKAWLGSQGIEMIFAIAPNKHSIYPEFLPDGISIHYPNSTDRLVEKAIKRSFNIIDMRPAFRTQKPSTPYLYNRTDSHWTSVGAYVGYQMIMRRLSEFWPSINYVTPNIFKYKPIRRKACCLARLLKISGQLGNTYDNGYSINFPGINGRICVAQLDYNSEAKSECTNSKNKRLSIHKSATEVRNDQGRNKINVMILRDSFGGNHHRLINDAFVLAWHYHYAKIANEDTFRSLVEKHQPDAVVYQVIERALFSKPFYQFATK